MNLREVFFSAFVIFSIISVTYFILYPDLQVSYSPPDGYMSLDIPMNCSEQRIKETWPDFFLEDYTNLTIFNKSEGGVCVDFVAYQTNETQLRFLLGNYIGNSYYISPRTYVLNYTVIDAYSLNFTNSDFYGWVLPNLTLFRNTTDFRNFLDNIFEDDNSYYYLAQRSIHNLSEANKTISSVFHFGGNNRWEEYEFFNDTVYSFSNSTTINENNVTNYFLREGAILANHTLDSVRFGFEKEYSYILGCVPNWTQVNTTCNSTTETLVYYYYDSKYCNNYTTYPGNSTAGCDYNKNGIIGTLSDVATSNINPEFYIDDTKVNFTNGRNYTSEEEVEFREGNITRVSFDYDFSAEPLNLKEVEIKKQSSSSDYGYLIINGINEEKTVRVDKETSTEAICIKDSTISGISSISDDCGDNDEYYIECPGENDDFECSLSSADVLVVSGLDHSGVREMEELSDTYNNNGGSSSSRCVQNWSCTIWGQCMGGQRYRICTDSKNCNNVTGKPSESEACTPTCTPNWDCEWTPETCPEDETQEYSCFDVNNCGNNVGKPSNVRNCTYEKPKTWAIFAVIGLAALLLLLVFILVIVIKKYRSD